MRVTAVTVPLLLGVLAAGGCSVAGTTAIRSGRAVYNDVIVSTNNEQILSMILHMRYLEPYGLLDVASVTANVRIQTSVGAQFGVGSSANYAGNLVPISAGALYEENPTISYTPVQGEAYLRQMLSPLPLDIAVLLMSALGDTPAAMMLLVDEINGIRNPEFDDDSSSTQEDRFVRVADLLASLHRRGFVTWAQEAADPPTFALVLRGEGADYAEAVARLHELLGLDKPTSLDELITLRVLLAVGQRKDQVIELRTRSVHDLFRIAAASVDVPEEHLESGQAPRLPPSGPVGAQIRIRRSAGRPPDAMVAVEFRGWWYSIGATDARSKETFRLLEAVMSTRIAEATRGHSGVPVLTVPVSR